MSKLPVAGWTLLGASSNAEFYAITDDIIGVVPAEQCTDDQGSARESLAFQEAHWRAVGHRGAAVVFMDRVLVQDGGARAVYQDESHGILSTCFALVGETFFGKVTASVFTGLTKPSIPTRVFRSLAEAEPWIIEMNRARGGPL
jgi:hypothetical protein